MIAIAMAVAMAPIVMVGDMKHQKLYHIRAVTAATYWQSNSRNCTAPYSNLQQLY